MAEQKTVNGVHFTNEGTGTTRAAIAKFTAGLAITHETLVVPGPDTLACSLVGTTATYTGETTLTGETDGGTTHVGVEVSGS